MQHSRTQWRAERVAAPMLAHVASENRPMYSSNGRLS